MTLFSSMFFNRQSNLPTTGDAIADRLLKLISDQVGITGWEVARSVSLNPTDVEAKLKELLDKELVKADGTGLDAYYAPSKSFARVRISGAM
ncbi:MAG: hypothetical protein ABIR80_19765 [Opitutaceae bacterium]